MLRLVLSLAPEARMREPKRRTRQTIKVQIPTILEGVLIASDPLEAGLSCVLLWRELLLGQGLLS